MKKTAYTTAEIAARVGGEVVGDGTVVVTGFSPAESAGPGDLTFAENESFFLRAQASAASAILVSDSFDPGSKVLIRVSEARVAFARALPLFFPERNWPCGVHPSAVIAPEASVDPTAHVGPGVVVESGAQIGPRCVLQAGAYLGMDVVLEEEVIIHPRVSVYSRVRVGKRVRIHAGSVVGSDGFGYVLDKGRHRKVPQIGGVIIHDDVEIGANVTIDRGALGDTVIGKGTKIDNLVQIGHNVVIGEHCIVVSQVGIAGSTRIGDFVTIAGQVGIAGHLKIGDRVTIAAQSGVMNSIPAGEKWFGSPAQRDRQMKRQLVAGQQLPEFIQRVRRLENRLPSDEEPDSGSPS